MTRPTDAGSPVPVFELNRAGLKFLASAVAVGEAHLADADKALAAVASQLQAAVAAPPRPPTPPETSP